MSYFKRIADLEKRFEMLWNSRDYLISNTPDSPMKNWDESGFMQILSETNPQKLEKWAQKSVQITRQYFGKTIQLYAPLYISDHCTNHCIYCGYSQSRNFKRKTLSIAECLNEAQVLAEAGIKHILLLSGESRQFCPPEFLLAVIRELRKIFSSISLEVYPMDTKEYELLKKAGVDGVTIYQEVYDQQAYMEYHLSGKKRNYRYRLDTPERILKAGIPHVNLGSLLGLAPPERELFLLAGHVRYLLNKFPHAEISVSFPRLKHVPSNFSIPRPISDFELVRFIIATRILLPRVGIVLSTRENESFRNRLFKLGVTRMSAGSSTQVGGYSIKKEHPSQFETEDKRSVEEVKNFLIQQGYQPVYKDWEFII